MKYYFVKLSFVFLFMFNILVGLFLTSVFSGKVLAARIPESLIRDQYVSTEGFSLNFKGSDWMRSEPPGNIKNKMDVLFRSTLKESQSTLSVRVDTDLNSKTLKEYVNKWLKSYAQFKLDVLGHKYFKTENEETGFVVDIKSTSEKRSRQVIFFKNAKAVVLTCTDSVLPFSETLKSCNTIIKTFTWIEPEPAAKTLKGL